VGESYLGARLDSLRRAQNPDGGWGYFPGKRSWLEPTLYAALALHGEPGSDKGWDLLRSWQQPDGSWRPSNEVQISNWGASLCVTLATVRGEFGEPFRKGVTWLLGSTGVESNLLSRAAARLGLLKAERDLSLRGWPWKPNTSSWVEPTAHALVALKKASAKFASPELRERVRVGEAQILDVRCRDGGWNYGSPAALGVELPSYPETTALALLGLQGRGDLGNALEVASRMAQETVSPLARAWLAVSLRLHGASAQPAAEAAPSPDVMITAIEALAAPEGNHQLLKTGGPA
jgi:hypothetical protein